MDTIGIKLKKLRENNGLTGKEAVEKLKKLGIDISAKTLYGYESGRNSANADMFLALCQIYKCQNIMEIFSDSADDILLTNKEWKIIEKYRFISNHSPEGAKAVDMLLDREHSIAGQLLEKNRKISELEQPSMKKHNSNPEMRIINYYYRLASAGTGQIVFDTPPTKRIEIPAIPEYTKVDYAIGVNGDSMEPIFHEGDTLLIEMTEELGQGEIGIFLVDGESYVKKLGNGELISLNPEYKNIPLTLNSKCMGKVLGKL